MQSLRGRRSLSNHHRGPESRAKRLATAKKTLEEAHFSTKVYTFSTAIADAEKVKSMFAEVREQVELDVLVLNAGMGNKPSPTLDIPVDEFWKKIEINVRANMSFVTEFLKPKTILNVSTTIAHIRLPSLAPYGASKEAFVALLDHVQAEYKDKGIKIVSFHPSVVYTSMAKSAGFDEKTFDYDQVDMPGQFALWLASEDADFLGGKFVYAGWDVEELKARAKEIEGSELLRVGLIGEPAV